MKELLYNGIDAVIAMFSLADRDSLEGLQGFISNEVRVYSFGD